MLRVALDALKAAGVQDISFDLTLPDLVDTLATGAMPVDPARIGEVRALLDAKDAGGLAAAGAEAYLPLLSAAGPIDSALTRLRALDRTQALDSRLAGIERIAAAIGQDVALTLDPTERHGFEYQSWIGFSLFGGGLTGEIGRGGSYTIVHPDGREEPAVGFSLYLDRWSIAASASSPHAASSCRSATIPPPLQSFAARAGPRSPRFPTPTSRTAAPTGSTALRRSRSEG